MTPAERLRAAADRLETLDKAAEPGPWVVDAHGRSVVMTSPVFEITDSIAESDANLIAALRPLAPWAVRYLRSEAVSTERQLDIWAYHVGHCGWHTRGDAAGGRCTCFDPALALADAILGGAR